MSPAHPSKRKPRHMRCSAHVAQGGFSLIEMMIALVLGLIVMGAAVAIFSSNRTAYATSNGMSQVQDNVRVAFEMMARDMRAAGLNGCGPASRVANVLNNGPNAVTTAAWYADIGNAMIGYDSGSADPAVTTGTASGQRLGTTSSVEIVGADGVGVSLATDTPSTATMTLNESSSNLAVGNFIVICDPNHSVITQLTSYSTTTGSSSGSALTLVHGSSSGSTLSPGNCSQGLGYPTSCGSVTGNSYQFAPNTQLAKLYAADWYVGYNPVGGTSLYRMTPILGGTLSTTPTPTAQEIVRNVTGMTITYLTSAGTSYVSASAVGTSQTAWSTVVAANVTLTIQSVSQNAATGTTTGSNGTQAIARTFSTTIALRNRVQ